MPLPAQHENGTASERSAPVDALTRRFASPIQGSTAGDLNAPDACDSFVCSNASSVTRLLFGHSWSSDAVRAEPKALIEGVALDELMNRTFDQLIFCESRQLVTECVQVVIFID